MLASCLLQSCSDEVLAAWQFLETRFRFLDRLRWIRLGRGGCRIRWGRCLCLRSHPQWSSHLVMCVRGRRYCHCFETGVKFAHQQVAGHASLLLEELRFQTSCFLTSSKILWNPNKWKTVKCPRKSLPEHCHMIATNSEILSHLSRTKRFFHMNESRDTIRYQTNN